MNVLLIILKILFILITLIFFTATIIHIIQFKNKDWKHCKPIHLFTMVVILLFLTIGIHIVNPYTEKWQSEFHRDNSNIISISCIEDMSIINDSSMGTIISFYDSSMKYYALVPHNLKISDITQFCKYETSINVLNKEKLNWIYIAESYVPSSKTISFNKDYRNQNQQIFGTYQINNNYLVPTYQKNH